MIKETICSFCKRIYKRQTSWDMGDNHYCNRKCFFSFHSTNSKYLVKSQTEIKHNVWLRDKNRCRKCLRSDRKLHIHHLDGSGDQNAWESSNNSMENLVTLCAKCHGYYHGINQKSWSHDIENIAFI